MSLTLPWKTLINIMPYEIVSSQYYKPLLYDVIEYPISEYEIENLPSSYISHFISIIQLTCKMLLEGNFQDNIYKNRINEDSEVIKQLKENLEYKNDELESNRKIISEYQKIISALQKNIFKVKESYKDKVDLYKTQLKDSQNRKINEKLDNMKIYMANLLQSQSPLQQTMIYYPQSNYNINENNIREPELKSSNTNIKIINNNIDEDTNQRFRSARVTRSSNNKNLYDTLNSLNLKITQESKLRDSKLNQLSNQFQQFQNNVSSQLNNFKNNPNSSRQISKSVFNK